jgi:hypothetical protein
MVQQRSYGHSHRFFTQKGTDSTLILLTLGTSADFGMNCSLGELPILLAGMISGCILAEVELLEEPVRVAARKEWEYQFVRKNDGLHNLHLQNCGDSFMPFVMHPTKIG